MRFSLPNNEPVDFYLNLVQPSLTRYSGPLDVIVDLGAHVGTFSVLAATEFGAKRVFAVEADPVNFSFLVANIGNNQLTSKVFPIMACIDVKSYETKKLYRAGSSGQRSTTFDPNKFNFVEVLSLGLGDLFNFIGKPIDFLKMDIEGSEWDLLTSRKGIYEEMQRVNYLNIELHPTLDPKYHKIIKKGQVTRALKQFKLMGFDLTPQVGEGWGYYGHRHDTRTESR